MSRSSFLLLWLEGPLQSWGVNSRFNRRASLDFPTRSGVMGIVCAALGAGGEQQELLESFAALPVSVVGYARATQAHMSALQLCDFHMVGSGYDDQDAWEKLHIPKTSDGKAAVGGGAKLTYRYYVQDMAFAVVMGVPQAMVQEVAGALQCPCWDLSLGRRCCVATEFIYQGLYENYDVTLARAQALAVEKGRVEALRVEETGTGEELILSDVPVCFGPRKRYRERKVCICYTEASSV